VQKFKEPEAEVKWYFYC